MYSKMETLPTAFIILEAPIVVINVEENILVIAGDIPDNRNFLCYVKNILGYHLIQGYIVS